MNTIIFTIAGGVILGTMTAVATLSPAATVVAALIGAVVGFFGSFSDGQNFN